MEETWLQMSHAQSVAVTIPGLAPQRLLALLITEIQNEKLSFRMIRKVFYNRSRFRNMPAIRDEVFCKF
jgi:hypothetical protein